jgi:hypothetical protein
MRYSGCDESQSKGKNAFRPLGHAFQPLERVSKEGVRGNSYGFASGVCSFLHLQSEKHQNQYIQRICPAIGFYPYVQTFI